MSLMQKFEFKHGTYLFRVIEWSENNYDLVAYDSAGQEVWRYPNSIYKLNDCSTHVRYFLQAKGLRIKWALENK